MRKGDCIMNVIYGKGVSAGVVAGPLYIYHRGNLAVEKTVSDAKKEWERFMEASKTAAKQLGELAVKARKEAGDEAAFLFEAHQMMAEDVEFAEAVNTHIHANGLNAEAAVEEAARQFVALFEAMNNEYMRARAADVKDVANRLIRILSCEEEGGIDSEVPVVLVADDLTPSETIRLDKRKILGFVTSGGSENGHTAILARMLGIPAIIGVGDALKAADEGKRLFMDGETGEIVIDPDEIIEMRMEKKQKELKREREHLTEYKALPTVTKDGRSIQLCCNIGSAEEVDAVREAGGEGIGLFRTELVFLQRDDYPTEEEQFAQYRAVAAKMEGKRVVFRTLDIGADKQPDYVALEREENPAMGLRAIRFCLRNPEIFRTQLKALYRASAYGKIAIMFPMITDVWEVCECKRICGEIREELKREGISFDETVELGVMIETPAAVMISDLLAKEVDFFSVGTNDLTQYMLALDRQNERLERFFDPHHQAVVRAIRLTADNAHREEIWVGICGELAADPKMTEMFLSMGIDELSVSPGKVLPLRKVICEMDASNSNTI